MSRCFVDVSLCFSLSEILENRNLMKFGGKSDHSSKNVKVEGQNVFLYDVREDVFLMNSCTCVHDINSDPDA